MISKVAGCGDEAVLAPNKKRMISTIAGGLLGSAAHFARGAGRRVLVGVAASLLTFAAATPPETRERPPSSPREYVNAGTRQLEQGKLREAETLLETALASQIERCQTAALYNLGHVRFGQGAEELKKGPPAKPTAARGRSAVEAADSAIQAADEALGGTDVQNLVASYLRGRGARKELRAAAKAVERALDSHGAALRKWQRSSGDFKSAVEMREADEDARHNADVVDRNIARLVDSLSELQMLANAIGEKQRELGEKMKEMKGRIPEKDMPPGAEGDEEEEEDQPQGPKPDQQEGPSREGEEGIRLTPEQAEWLLEGFRLDADRKLPMGQESSAQPRDRNRPTW